jgi:cytochrome b561
MKNNTSRYTLTAIVIHWVVALGIVVSFFVGLYMVGLPFSPDKLQLYNWHKWAGITILTLSALRLLWRLTHRPPADLPAPAWQKFAAHATHNLLYVLFFAVPLVGWAFTSAAGFQVVLFGVLPLPDLVSADKALAKAIKPWHAYLAYAMGALVVMHVAAALKHQFIDRDGLIGRMWPAGRRPSTF